MIFHIITNFTELGGAESALIRIVNSTTNSDEHITVISLMGANIEMVNKITQGNCRVIALRANNAVNLLLCSFKVTSLIYSLKPNKIYSWMYHSNAIASLACLFAIKKTTLIWGVRHSFDDYSGEKTSTKVAIHLGKLLKFVPHKVIYCSKKSQVQHELFGYSSIGKSLYIPNGYEFEVFEPKVFSGSSFVIGAAGRFHESKDYSTLFRTIKRLKVQKLSFEFRICGRGMDYENKELIKLIEESGLDVEEVTLLGEVNDMSVFYKRVDLFILSSKTEGFPNVLAEAASYGCAVFSTNVGDAPYIINNIDHIAPVKNDKKLAECISKFLDRPSEIKHKEVLATTQYVRDNFTIEAIAKRFSEV